MAQVTEPYFFLGAFGQVDEDRELRAGEIMVVLQYGFYMMIDFPRCGK